jgi:hypothetical protein
MSKLNFIANNETLSTVDMANVKGGTQTPPFSQNYMTILKTKYAGAPSQQFTMVVNGQPYQVVMNSSNHTLCIKSNGLVVAKTKY